jgi:hypothetical protein
VILIGSLIEVQNKLAANAKEKFKMAALIPAISDPFLANLVAVPSLTCSC